ncbi:MAG: radical SAM protein, partial [Pseudomonadota bacterium]
RTMWGEVEADARKGYSEFIARMGLNIDPTDASRLVLFPEMKPDSNPPEISTGCWDILSVSADDQMCASQRMVVRRRGAKRASVVACTLLPYDERFDLGHTLSAARGDVSLNHPYCASFCVLGGGSCSA